MTEAEWLACDDPVQLIATVLPHSSHRKLQLFAIACCYHSRFRAQEPPLPQFECVLRYADRVGTLEEVREFWLAPHATSLELSWPEQPEVWASGFVEDCDTGEEGYPPKEELLPFVRDIFGNPFRPVTFSPAWRTDTTIALARTMYDARDFSAMPILADALQDAGCDNTDILDHCRGPGPHVRGCWVVDLVLGKQ